jgi:hypothetical protein
MPILDMCKWQFEFYICQVDQVYAWSKKIERKRKHYRFNEAEPHPNPIFQKSQ